MFNSIVFPLIAFAISMPQLLEATIFTLSLQLTNPVIHPINADKKSTIGTRVYTRRATNAAAYVDTATADDEIDDEK